MSSEQRLQHKRHALQEHYDLLAEKLKRLRRDYAIAFLTHRMINQTFTNGYALLIDIGLISQSQSSMQRQYEIY